MRSRPGTLVQRVCMLLVTFSFSIFLLLYCAEDGRQDRELIYRTCGYAVLPVCISIFIVNYLSSVVEERF